MCLPLVPLAIGASLAGAGVAAYGSYQQGQSAKAMNNFQADMAGQQSMLAARAAEQNTTLTQIQAANQSKNSARDFARLEGAARAAQGANGTAGSGTSLDISKSNFDTHELDMQAIRYNADVNSWAIKNQLAGEQWNLAAEGTQYKAAGRNAAKAGNIGAVSNLLQGATQAASFGIKATPNTGTTKFSSGGKFSNTAPFKPARF